MSETYEAEVFDSVNNGFLVTLSNLAILLINWRRDSFYAKIIPLNNILQEVISEGVGFEEKLPSAFVNSFGVLYDFILFKTGFKTKENGMYDTVKEVLTEINQNLYKTKVFFNYNDSDSKSC
ncbi:UNVERIFIED_CONTAM: hypothetical protein NCL1_17099 [Trichonephila clavipes]